MKETKKRGRKPSNPDAKPVGAATDGTPFWQQCAGLDHLTDHIAETFCGDCAWYKKGGICLNASRAKDENRNATEDGNVTSPIATACKHFLEVGEGCMVSARIPEQKPATRYTKTCHNSNERRCAVCGRWLPKTSFWPVARGWSKACKECSPVSPMARPGACPKRRKPTATRQAIRVRKPLPETKAPAPAPTRKEESAVRLMSSAVERLSKYAAQIRKDAAREAAAAKAMLKQVEVLFPNITK
ncbi:MAG: hypothetical protein IKE76_09440 [Clostridia bacterium]|nr:hypothetical protein [Clostridia bacterium]